MVQFIFKINKEFVVNKFSNLDTIITKKIKKDNKTNIQIADDLAFIINKERKKEGKKEKSPYSENTISKWKNKKMFPAEYLPQIAKYFNCKISDLFFKNSCEEIKLEHMIINSAIEIFFNKLDECLNFSTALAELSNSKNKKKKVIPDFIQNLIELATYIDPNVFISWTQQQVAEQKCSDICKFNHQLMYNLSLFVNTLLFTLDNNQNITKISECLIDFSKIHKIKIDTKIEPRSRYDIYNVIDTRLSSDLEYTALGNALLLICSLNQALKIQCAQNPIWLERKSQQITFKALCNTNDVMNATKLKNKMDMNEKEILKDLYASAITSSFLTLKKIVAFYATPKLPKNKNHSGIRKIGIYDSRIDKYINYSKKLSIKDTFFYL